MSAIPPPQRSKLATRSGGNCEICYFERATNWHHRKNRSQGGRHELSNAMHLCGSGTTGCHGTVTENPALAYDRGWSVRSGHEPADVPLVYQGDWALLDDDGFVFRPVSGRDRCERCGFHVPTQGHRSGCQVA